MYKGSLIIWYTKHVKLVGAKYIQSPANKLVVRHTHWWWSGAASSHQRIAYDHITSSLEQLLSTEKTRNIIRVNEVAYIAPCADSTFSPFAHI